VLTLADFGTVHILSPHATTSSGHPVRPGACGVTTTRVRLGDTSSADAGTVERTQITATPSASSKSTGAFAVVYAAKTTTASGSTGGVDSPPAHTGPPGAVSRSTVVTSSAKRSLGELSERLMAAQRPQHYDCRCPASSPLAGHAPADHQDYIYEHPDMTSELRTLRVAAGCTVPGGAGWTRRPEAVDELRSMASASVLRH
jgi:hypothetical protein